MNNNDWETRVQKAAKAFAYPPTPDVAATFRRQRRGAARQTMLRVAQGTTILLLILMGLMAVPQIRAQVIAFFRIGAVDVIVTTATPPARFSGGDLPDSVLDFPGATTLEDARQHAGYPVRLPSALGVPDRVYLVQAERLIVVLVWLDASGAVDVSLHLLPSETYVLKMTSGTPASTEVNGSAAIWLADTHDYMLRMGVENYKLRNVTMPALVWEAPDGITYRLETNRSEGEAVRIAESIPTATP
jgi:hypothetical protein